MKHEIYVIRGMQHMRREALGMRQMRPFSLLKIFPALTKEFL